MDFWSSSEQLGKLNQYLQTGLVVLGIATALFGVASFFINQRKEALEYAEKRQLQARVSTVENKATEITPLVHRSLSPQQRLAIDTALTGVKPSTVMAILHNSKESEEYLKQIEDVLVTKGWKVEHFFGGSFRNESNFRLGLNSKYKCSLAFEALSRGLKEAKIAFSQGEIEATFDHEILLDVGVIEATPYQAVIDKVQ